MDPTSPPLIRTHGLVKRFGEKIAVGGLDLVIPAGEFFCFLGPNGAGKTTTIKMLTGLVRPTEGRAEIGGHDIQTDSVRAKALVGYVPDHPYLYDKLTCREVMRFVAGLYRLSDAEFHERCDRLLDTFEILPMGDMLVQDLSHGMRQKLSFASCFLHDPQLVIVDEPWVGLDPYSTRKVKTYLKERTREGLTIFMSTHTLSIAEELADRIGIIHRGKLLHVGTVAEVKEISRHPGNLEDVFLKLTRPEDGEEDAGSAAV